MFGKKHVAKLVEQEPIKPIPLERPRPHLVVVEKKPIEEYEKLSSELEFFPVELIEAKFLRYLSDNKIRVFDNGEVAEYLREKAEDKKEMWVWKPLREKDKWQGSWGWDRWLPGRFGGKGHGFYRASEPKCRPYTKLVPYKILELVRDIETEIPEGLSFFVSDYVAVNPDPFIMATALDMNRIIFGVWDEPDFGII